MNACDIASKALALIKERIATFSETVKEDLKCCLSLRAQQICWKKPPANWFKVNLDGFVRSVNDLGITGFIIRGWEGRFFLPAACKYAILRFEVE